MWSQKCFVAGRGNPTIPAEAMFMKDFKLVLSFCGLWSCPPKYLGSCEQLFDANLRLQDLIG